MLIFETKNSPKAFLCYDIKDSEINGRYVEEIKESAPRKSCKRIIRDIKKSKKIRTVRSKSLNQLQGEKSSVESKNTYNKLNYIIEISNAFIQNCFLKSKNLIESIEFYNELARIE